MFFPRWDLAICPQINNCLNTSEGFLHTGPFDAGAAPGDQVGVFLRAVPVLPVPATNRVDAAVATLTASHDLQVLDIGRVTGRTNAQDRMRVCKQGRTTKYTEGV